MVAVCILLFLNSYLALLLHKTHYKVEIVVILNDAYLCTELSLKAFYMHSYNFLRYSMRLVFFIFYLSYVETEEWMGIWLAQVLTSGEQWRKDKNPKSWLESPHSQPLHFAASVINPNDDENKI